MHNISRFLTAALLTVAPAASANVAFKDAPKQTPAQAKNFNWVDEAGGLRCEPKAKLAELVGKPYECYINLDECKAAVDTLAGTIDPAMIELYADMATIDPKGEKAKFVNTCPGENGPQFVELLAIRGLGYARDAKYGPLLAKIVEGPRAGKVGNGLRTAVTEALAYMGDKTVAEPAYKNLLAVTSMDPEYKDTILATLDAWNSDAGVDFCTGALTSEDDKKSVEACTFYLGRRKATAAVPVLQRNLEPHETVTIHALGQIGGKDALSTVQQYLTDKAKAPYRTRIPALVAAVNLGDKTALAELQTYLAGKKPAPPASGKSKAKAKAPKAEPADPEIMGVAAMESLLLTDKAAIAAAQKSIQAAAAGSDTKEWKGWVYANIALAQRGDAKALAKLAELLASPKAEIRNAVVNAIGGRDMHVGEYFPLTGFGYVADAGVASALEKYIAVETSKESKVKAVQALGKTRAMLVAKK